MISSGPRRRPRGRRTILALLALATVLLALGCGRRGPPLPPLEGSVPRIADLELRQVGREHRATFSLPRRPDQSEIDYITHAIQLWRRALVVDEEGRVRESPEDIERGGFVDGAELVDEITGEGLFVLLAGPTPEMVAPLPTELPEGGYEYAIVLKTNLRGRGTLSNVERITALAPPPPPIAPRLEMTEGVLLLTWDAPELPMVEPVEEGAEPTPLPVTYAVYRAIDDGPFDPEPVSGAGLPAPPFADSDVAIGRTYRYRVATIADSESGPLSSELTLEVAESFRDVFPPTVPTGLRIIREGDGVAILIWNPNTEPDLAGYGVYRREKGGAWERLDSGIIRAATFRDPSSGGDTVEYAVSAYDGATPPNESERCAPASLASTGP
ncbi:MAG: hypothetical protein AAF533_22580 [Acidobacteriota bacterium]